MAYVHISISKLTAVVLVKILRNKTYTVGLKGITFISGALYISRW